MVFIKDSNLGIFKFKLQGIYIDPIHIIYLIFFKKIIYENELVLRPFRLIFPDLFTLEICEITDGTYD